MHAHLQPHQHAQQGQPGDPARPSAAARSHDVHPVLQLHRAIGNRAVQGLLQAGPDGFEATSDVAGSGRLGRALSVHAGAPVRIQTRLAVNTPGDVYEEEADRLSDQVMRMPEPQLQRACHCGGDCADCQAEPPGQPPELLQRKPAGTGAVGRAAAPPVVHEVLSAPGRPLDPSPRGFMEPRFRHDLSHVRIHTGRRAAESARAVKALAFTVGDQVVFGEGQFSPGTPAGQRLLAHELVHTLQQSRSPESVGMVHRQTSLDIALRSPGVAAQVLGSEILDGFALNSHALTGEHTRRLRDLAKRLKELLREHHYGTAVITGHTDATGEEAYNEQLGWDRADAVAAFLRKSGVPALALQAESAGERELRVPTDKPEPRNRRVEIRFLPELPTPPEPTPKPGPAEAPKTPGGVPRPENLCTEHPEICDPTTTTPEAMPSCSSTNCSAVSGRPLDQMPPDLRLVLTKSFKANAAEWLKQPENGLALTQIFNRLCNYGVWCRVRLVLRIEPGEAPLGHTVKVYGSTPSVFFTSPSAYALLADLMATGRFCLAFGAGASLHPGPTAREISGSDSLHISIVGENTLEAHVDRYSPVPESPGSAFCPNEPTPAAVGHITREVLPGEGRRRLGGWGVLGGTLLGGFFSGIPGAVIGGIAGVGAGSGALQIYPDPGPPAPVPPGAVGPEPFRSSPRFSLTGVLGLLLSALLDTARATVHGPLPERPEPLVPHEAKAPSPDVAALEAKVVAPMQRELEQKVSRYALLPSRVRVRRRATQEQAERAGPDEEARLRQAAQEAEEEASSYPDAVLLGLDLAARIEQARRRGDATARLVLGPEYGGLDDIDRRFIAGQIRTIALIVRKHLPDRAAGVRWVLVFFGVINNVTSEVIDLPE